MSEAFTAAAKAAANWWADAVRAPRFDNGDTGMGSIFAGALAAILADGQPVDDSARYDEKLDHVCRDRAYSFSEDRFIRRVTEAAEGWPDADELVAEAREAAYYEAEAREWLSEHENGFPDSWEWELKDLDHHYLLACYAVVTTIADVRIAKGAAA